MSGISLAPPNADDALADAQSGLFQGIGDLPGGRTESCALALSADGEVITGWSAGERGSQAFRWVDGEMSPLHEGYGITPSVGHALSANGAVIVGLAHSGDKTVGFRWEDGKTIALFAPAGYPGFVDASGVSGDGRTIVGSVQSGGRSQALRWDDGVVSVLVAVEQGAPGISSLASAISADGRTIVGYRELDQGMEAICWKDGHATRLPTVPGGASRREALAVSADGGVIVGSSGSRFGIEACIWQGMEFASLGSISREHEFLSTARGVSPDGAVIVGSAIDDRDASQAIAWEAVHGMLTLRTVLAADLGLDVDGWQLHAATGVSADGHTIVGCGLNPQGQQEGWIARLPAGWWRDAAAPLTPDPIGPNDGPERAILGRGTGALADSLLEPHGVALERGGKAYVADAGNDAIRVFTADGALSKTLGSPGSGLRFSGPRDVFVADDGTVFVADTGNDRVQIIDAAGRLRRTWGSTGNAAGQLAHPEGIAADGSRVYVADTGNDRVQVFDLTGRHVQSIGGFGHGLGELNAPEDLAVHADGAVFVADTGNHRVCVFGPDGSWRRAFGERGSSTGLFNRPTGIDCRGDDVYVVDQANHRVQVFTTGGTLRYAWGRQVLRPHEDGGRILFPARIAVASERARAAICEPVEGRCQWFGMIEGAAPSPFNRQSTIDRRQSSDSTPLAGVARAIHVSGDVLTLIDDAAGHILVYRLTGHQPSLLTKVGVPGFGIGQLADPRDLRYDAAAGRLLVADTGNRRIQAFDLHLAESAPAAFVPNLARLTRTLHLSAKANGASLRPTAVASGPAGVLAVADERTGQVALFDGDFRELRRVGGPGDSETEIRRPVDITFCRGGRQLLVLDAERPGVVAFDTEGTYIRAWGKRGFGPGEFVSPSGMGIGDDGVVYVCDQASHRVQKFDEAGTLVAQWGKPGVGRGELFRPKDVAVGDSGRVYVNDFGNRRICVFTGDGSFLYAIGSPLVVHPTLVSEGE